MHLGWIATYGSDTKMSIQISFVSQGGSGTEVPDISIEVDDVDEAYRRSQLAVLSGRLSRNDRRSFSSWEIWPLRLATSSSTSSVE